MEEPKVLRHGEFRQQLYKAHKDWEFKESRRLDALYYKYNGLVMEVLLSKAREGERAVSYCHILDNDELESLSIDDLEYIMDRLLVEYEAGCAFIPTSEPAPPKSEHYLGKF